MIEFKARNKKALYHSDNWKIVPDPSMLHHGDFDELIFRVDNTIYTTWDEKFEAIIAWEKLKS